MTIRIILGDITTRSDDAIVNAANSSLRAGGGVCGAIHRAAGPELDAACLLLGGCPTGGAVLTPGFKLPARHVIHAVGPSWMDGQRNEPQLLELCYRRILDLALSEGIKTISLPAISTGIFRYPVRYATTIALRVARDCAGANVVPTFVCFDQATYEIYLAKAAEL